MIAFISCNEEQDLDLSVNQNDAGKEIVLKERDSRYPLILSQRKTKPRNTKSIPTLSFSDYLGRSFTCSHFPLGDPEDIKIQVINTEKLMRDYPSYFWKNEIGKGEAQSFAYTGFDRYTENSSTTKKINNAGFTLNLGLFSLGAHKTMTEVFTTSKVEESKRIFGELNIQIRDASYYMQTSSNIIKKIKLDYLTEDFKEELYNLTPSEFFNNYGGFVLSSFITGGRATALYTGIYRNNESTETKEKNMNTDISASYGFKFQKDKDGNVSAEGGIGKDYSHATTSTNKIEAMETSVKTIGGSPFFSNFSIPTKVDNADINLSQWVSSLNDKNTHKIIDIADEGLIPITEFMLEENMKKDFKYFIENGVPSITQIREPYLEINRAILSGTLLSQVTTTLVTRFNQRIRIKWHMGNPHDTHPEYIKNEAKRLSKIYGLKIIQIINPESLDIFANDKYTNIKDLDETKMKKFVDTKHNTTYLLYSEGEKKYAYAIHYDYLLDTYAIRDFVNSLPTIQIDPQDLFNYTIIAL
ncbi:MAC/perforin domain-containing protein [Phocaeicola massiliensis]